MNTSQSIMNDQHRATDSEWYCIKSRGCGSKSDVVAYSTIHELLCRIKALEAAARPAQPNYPENPGGSLVEQVAFAIYRDGYGSGDGFHEEARDVIREEARAAIRAVAAWVRKNYGGPTATTDLLEQEAER